MSCAEVRLINHLMPLQFIQDASDDCILGVIIWALSKNVSCG